MSKNRKKLWKQAKGKLMGAVRAQRHFKMFTSASQSKSVKKRSDPTSTAKPLQEPAKAPPPKRQVSITREEMIAAISKEQSKSKEEVTNELRTMDKEERDKYVKNFMSKNRKKLWKHAKGKLMGAV